MKIDELAQKRWESIPGDLRKKLEENVFCPSCGVTTITNYHVASSDYKILLIGECKQCNEEVRRLID